MSGSSGSSNQSSAPQATPQQLADAYKNNLPSILGVTNAQATPTAQSLANAATSVSSANQFDTIELVYGGVTNAVWIMQSGVSAGFVIV